MTRPSRPYGSARYARWLILFGLLAGALAAPAPAGAQTSTPEPARERIAVLDLQPVGASEEEAVALTERLRELLVKTERFVIVDRSRLEAVLDEQALQQASCTEQACAIKVGQLLGVRKLIVGKAVKISEGAWQLSALMVDVETARTLSVESLRYKGELFDLLDERVPALAQRLAGLKALPETTEPAPPDSARRTGTARLALFPAKLDGSFANRLKNNHLRLVKRIGQIVGEFAPEVRLTFSAYPFKGGEEAFAAFKKTGWSEDWWDRTWTGFFTAEPDDGFIYQVARELDLDLVLLHRTSLSKGTRTLTVYLLDVQRRRRFEYSTTWQPRAWGIGITEGIDAVMADYRASRR